MPNTSTPITTSIEAINYKKLIEDNSDNDNFEALIPCYLTDNLNIDDFENALQNDIFIGGKLYPNNATTNSQFGVNDIKQIYNIFEILEKYNKTLLIHGELNRSDIDIFDREKYFIDEELQQIRKSFQDLKIVLEHVSSDYGVDFVKTNNNIAGTITPHHMLLTKKDVFKDEVVIRIIIVCLLSKMKMIYYHLEKQRVLITQNFFWVLTQPLIILITKSKMTL